MVNLTVSNPPFDSDNEPEPINFSTYSLLHPIPKPTPTPPAVATTLQHLSINQDHTCFAVGLSTGFRIYSCDPYKPIMLREDFETSNGGIRFVAMLFRYSLMCLMTGLSSGVGIWDDYEQKYLGVLSPRFHVKNVKLRFDKIVIVLTQKIIVRRFKDFRVLHEIDTVVNPKGLCEVSYNEDGMVLVCPGLRKGQVRVDDYGGGKKTKYIMAHNSRIVSLGLTLDGRFLATASSKGTLIRVFDTMDGSLLQEMRRGADRAEIYSLAFSKNAQWLAVSSDKGTVHVFGLKLHSTSLETCDTSQVQTTRPVPDVSSPTSSSLSLSSLSFFKGVLPKYFSSERSVAQIRLKEGVEYLVGFGKQNYTIVIVGMDGSYYKCEFDPVEGGEMTRLEHYNFMNPSEPF